MRLAEECRSLCRHRTETRLTECSWEGWRQEPEPRVQLEARVLIPRRRGGAARWLQPFPNGTLPLGSLSGPAPSFTVFVRRLPRWL